MVVGGGRYSSRMKREKDGDISIYVCVHNKNGINNKFQDSNFIYCAALSLLFFWGGD